MTPVPDLPPEYEAYKTRLAGYIARAACFPFDWGRPEGRKDRFGMPLDLFRYDAKRLAVVIDRAEHLLRCLMIWMAMIRIRAGLVTRDASAPIQLPVDLQSGQNPSIQPIHLDLTLRNIPLYEPRLAPFRISLPELNPQHDTEDRAVTPWCEAKTTRTQTRKGYKGRPRNDAVLASDKLIKRLHRLGSLLDTLDARADRIAHIWAARITAERTGHTPEKTALAAQNPDSLDQSVRRRPELRPLKTNDPPDKLLDTAPEDERDDIIALHDAALRAADRFVELCI